MRSQIKAFLADENGTSSIDYCLISGTIVTAIIGPLEELGQALANLFLYIAAVLQVS